MVHYTSMLTNQDIKRCPKFSWCDSEERKFAKSTNAETTKWRNVGKLEDCKNEKWEDATLYILERLLTILRRLVSSKITWSNNVSRRK